MSIELIIDGYNGDGYSVFDVNSDNEGKVSWNRVDGAEKAGYISTYTESDLGNILGIATNKSPETSPDFRIRSGMDTLLFSDTINYGAQDTARWCYRTSTLTTTFGGGFMNLNGASNTAAGSTSMNTYKYFSLLGTASLYCEVTAEPSNVIPSDFTVDFGMCILGTSAPFAPTDGVYFRITNDGICGILNNKGIEYSTGRLLENQSIGLGKMRKYLVQINDKTVNFWIDEILYGTIQVSRFGQAMLAGSEPFSARLYQPAITGLACQFKISEVTITAADIQYVKKYKDQLASMGFGGYQGSPGGTVTTDGYYLNNMVVMPAVAATNTTAAVNVGATTTLGGQFSFLPTLTAGTDGIICSYQVPAASTTYTGKSLMIYGVDIWSIVTTTLVTTTGPIVGAWSLGIDNTAVSLATANAAATRASRRIPLGTQYFATNAVRGVTATPILIQFANPKLAQPGAFVQIVFKNMGVVTSAGVITCLIRFDTLWE